MNTAVMYYCHGCIIAMDTSYVYTYHSILNEVGQHDDCPTLPITDDFPHVSDGGGYWAFCYDISLLLLISLHTYIQYKMIKN